MMETEKGMTRHRLRSVRRCVGVQNQGDQKTFHFKYCYSAQNANTAALSMRVCVSMRVTLKYITSKGAHLGNSEEVELEGQGLRKSRYNYRIITGHREKVKNEFI